MFRVGEGQDLPAGNRPQNFSYRINRVLTDTVVEATAFAGGSAGTASTSKTERGTCG